MSGNRDGGPDKSKFRLPTIKEFESFKEPEGKELADRPKRGLNFPRSKSIKPSVMADTLKDMRKDEADEAAKAPTEQDLIFPPDKPTHDPGLIKKLAAEEETKPTGRKRPSL